MNPCRLRTLEECIQFRIGPSCSLNFVNPEDGSSPQMARSLGMVCGSFRNGAGFIRIGCGYKANQLVESREARVTDLTCGMRKSSCLGARRTSRRPLGIAMEVKWSFTPGVKRLSPIKPRRHCGATAPTRFTSGVFGWRPPFGHHCQATNLIFAAG